MKQSIRPAVFAGALFWLSMVMNIPASGDWINPPPEELAEQSDLVVVGEFIGRDRLRLSADGRELIVGAIRVESVFKGDPERTIVLLMLPPPRPGGLVSSADVVIEDGQRGLWYLRLREDGLYTADEPYRFIAMEYAEAQIDVLQAMR